MTVHGETFDPEKYLEECVRIDDLCLNEEFVRVPADLAFWSARYADAVRNHLMAKHTLTTVESKLHLEHRAAAELTGRKITVGDLQAAVQTDQEYLDAAVAVIESDALRLRLRGNLDAVTAKKDMIQSLGAKLRAEMGADPMVRTDNTLIK